MFLKLLLNATQIVTEDTQIVTKLKNSNCDKNQNTNCNKNQKSNYDQTLKVSFW